MWCILSDNLSATNILNACEDPQSKEFKSDYYIQKYLYALILWEAIYKTPRKSYSTKVYNKADIKREESELVKRVKGTIFDLPFKYSPDDIELVANRFYEVDWCKSEFTNQIKEDAIFYLTLGQVQNMNTLLSEQRAKFVEKTGISRTVWSRENILMYIDKEVFDIYKEVYAFMGKDIFSMQMPLLIDYICDNATCLQDAINIAFQLKEQKDLIQFRRTMNSLDEAIDTGNILKIKEYENALSEIVNQFVKNDVKTEKIDIGLAITPCITNPSFEATFGIPIEYGSKRKINMNFLLNLTRYGLTQAYRRQL